MVAYRGVQAARLVGYPDQGSAWWCPDLLGVGYQDQERAARCPDRAAAAAPDPGWGAAADSAAAAQAIGFSYAVKAMAMPSVP